jgi:ribosomal protein S18 acetylase RimI-like enzyme
LRLRSLRSDPAAFGSTLAEELAFDAGRWKERAERAATALTVAQWVAEGGSGRLIGTTVIVEVEKVVHIFAMWVDPEFRGQGIGGSLLDAALEWGRSAFPGKSVVLEVNPQQTAAVRLYESRGFQATATYRPLGHTTGQQVREMILPPGNDPLPVD